MLKKSGAYFTRFTPAISKNKTFSLRLILDAITLYNRLYTLEESKDKVSEKYGIKMSCQNIRNWLKDFAGYLPFSYKIEYGKVKVEL